MNFMRSKLILCGIYSFLLFHIWECENSFCGHWSVRCQILPLQHKSLRGLNELFIRKWIFKIYFSCIGKYVIFIFHVFQGSQQKMSGKIPDFPWPNLLKFHDFIKFQVILWSSAVHVEKNLAYFPNPLSKLRFFLAIVLHISWSFDEFFDFFFLETIWWIPRHF